MRSTCFEFGAVGGRSQLVRLLDKSMSTLDSQHNTLAETTSARFGQLQRQFDMGGTVDDLRGWIEASEMPAPMQSTVIATERRSLSSRMSITPASERMQAAAAFGRARQRSGRCARAERRRSAP